jgi:hypothetical protein
MTTGALLGFAPAGFRAPFRPGEAGNRQKAARRDDRAELFHVGSTHVPEYV